jgi:hypothetical protein
MRTPPARPPLFPAGPAQRSGFPARGIPLSLLLHVLVLTGFLLLRKSPSFQLANPRHQPRQLAVIMPLEAIQSPSAGASGAAGKSGGNRASHAVANRSMAASFAGPQQVISDTKDPTNSVQTILQPEVLAPRRLSHPIAVPSTVKIAMPHPAPVLSAGESRPLVQAQTPPPPAWTPPSQHSPVETTSVTAQDLLAAAPKLPVFVSPVRNFSPQPTPPPPAPKQPAPPARVQAAAQKPYNLPPVKSATASSPPVQSGASPQAQMQAAPPTKALVPSGTGKDDRNLLVINAIDTQSAANDQLIAQNEIHGKFEVAPVNVPVGPKSSQGDLKPDKKPGTGSGSATANQIASSAGSNSGQTAGKEPGTSASGSATPSPNGQGSGTGTRGSSSGSAPQGASGSTSPFGAISIQGGTSSGGHGTGSGSTVEKPASTAAVQHGSYNMTIISSGSSGGGLRDFGTFRDGPVYTVYLDVSSLGITGTRWSLQYGAAREARLAHPGALLTPPFPSRQVLPKFPAARVAANIARLFVVQANISTEGTMEAIQILQSPDVTLNALLKECLLKWVFQSAAMGEDRVPVRVLIGIPVAAVMAQAPDSAQ